MPQVHFPLDKGLSRGHTLIRKLALNRIRSYHDYSLTNHVSALFVEMDCGSSISNFLSKPPLKEFRKEIYKA